MKGRAADRHAVTICRPDRTFDGYDAPTPARKRRRAGPRKPTRVAGRPAPAQDPAMPRRGVRHAGRRAAARFPRQPTHFRQGPRQPGSAPRGDPQPVAGPACPRTPTAWPGRGRPSHDQAGAGARPKVLQPVRTTGTIRSDERNTTGCRDAPTCRPKRAIRMRASAGPPAQAQGIGAGNPASATASRTSDPTAGLQSSSPSSSPSWLAASAAGRGRRLAGRLRIST